MRSADQLPPGPAAGLAPGGVVRFGPYRLTVGRTRYGYTIEVTGRGLKREAEAAALTWRNGVWEARKLDDAQALATVRDVLLSNMTLRELAALEGGPGWLAPVLADAMEVVGYREAERSLEGVLTHRTSWTLTIPLEGGRTLKVDLAHVPSAVPTYEWGFDDAHGLQLSNMAVGTQTGARALVGDLREVGVTAPSALRVVEAMSAQLPSEPPLTSRRSQPVDVVLDDDGDPDEEPTEDPPTPPPAPRAIEDARDAEEAMVDWMRWLGFHDATRTKSTRDGGIDIEASDGVAQVKDQGNVIAPGPVRELFGVAVSHNKEAVFFARAGYSKQARAFADRTDVALFRFSFHNEVAPVNDAAFRLWATAGGDVPRR